MACGSVCSSVYANNSLETFYMVWSISQRLWAYLLHTQPSPSAVMCSVHLSDLKMAAADHLQHHATASQLPPMLHIQSSSSI